MNQPTIALGPDGGFILTLPSTLEGRNHPVFIPGSPAGIAVLRKILSERAKEAARLQIGNAASPHEHMVREWLKAERQRQALEKAAEAEEKETKRMAAAREAVAGIDLGELDL